MENITILQPQILDFSSLVIFIILLFYSHVSRRTECLILAVVQAKKMCLKTHSIVECGTVPQIIIMVLISGKITQKALAYSNNAFHVLVYFFQYKLY